MDDRVVKVAYVISSKQQVQLARVKFTKIRHPSQ
jgi:hypothetical protein